MFVELQRARMAAVRDALASLRAHRQLFTADYGLVVSGALIPPLFLSAFTLVVCNGVEAHLIFHLRLSQSARVTARALVVPPTLAPHRVGVN
ncbi:hypothetical protein CYMTET_18876 [Cymbomonas tetramitiformis]|uniref:Uncharacterized protein n=1 Tax=Cymbomonas tetramitiformis TaxID=36881 RepID=A0AAE0G7B4_9CHLO|nr:hypothetical protein CYMTET_18876 [Cymbomonas tetramitiformis]